MKATLGSDFKIDLDSLIDTRLLIQANSGGGKSWAIRKLLEETHGKVQQIILDIEGDFASLREKYDYILAAKNGDIGVNPRSAELLARKVLELKADIIIDLYELKQHERIKFVRLFLDSMINAPKDLWHPVLVIIDEAHIFVPEKGQAESAGAVIDLMTRGRKRGFCGVLATQRLSKLHKDAAAECNNKMIGRTGLDIDMKRAADELGITAKEALNLRDLEPGSFFVFGPSISRQVALKIIGSVHTNHPSAGNRKLIHTPEPTPKVRSILSKLTDLPKEAEAELHDKAEMKAKISELNRKIHSLEKQSKDSKLDEKDLDKIKQFVEKAVRREAGQRFKDSIEGFMNGMQSEMKVILEEFDREFPIKMNVCLTPLIKKPEPYLTGGIKIHPLDPGVREVYPIDNSGLGKCEKSILGFLLSRADNPRDYTKPQLAAWVGYSHKSGSFNNALYKLNSMGLIVLNRGLIQIVQDRVDDIREIVGSNVDYSLNAIISKLGKCERSIYTFLDTNDTEAHSKQSIAESIGYSDKSGSFNNAIYKLNTLELIKRQPDGIIVNHEIRGL